MYIYMQIHTHHCVHTHILSYTNIQYTLYIPKETQNLHMHPKFLFAPRLGKKIRMDVRAVEGVPSLEYCHCFLVGFLS